VQGILAPLQFLVFLVSLFLVLRYLATGVGEVAATVSVVIKTLILYTIMITGSIWEKVVFGKYLFAKAFFWEDVFSMLVLALHTAYLGALLTGFLDVEGQMWLALAAYAAYVINATQFLLKLRAARLSQAAADADAPSGHHQCLIHQPNPRPIPSPTIRPTAKPMQPRIQSGAERWGSRSEQVRPVGAVDRCRGLRRASGAARARTARGLLRAGRHRLAAS
jgi:3-vinyl bacteriochlorophyllide hydratase